MKLALILGLLVLVPFAKAQPAITAKSAIVIEKASGVVLYEKGADDIRFPASTTKILTALLLLEHLPQGAVITAPADTESVTGASLYLKPGEQISREDAAYALLLRSANDVAHAVAVTIAGSDASFARLMNKRAKELGCTRTSFHNPHGLNDSKHATSARDLALITLAALKNPEFCLIARTKSHVISRTINTQDTLLKSKNRLLQHDSTFQGVKTGYTNPAGQCFVGLREWEGLGIVTVVLASKDWVADTKAIATWAHQEYKVEGRIPAGSVVGSAPVAHGVNGSVKAMIEDDFILLGKTHQTSNVEYLYDSLTAPVAKKQHIGYAVLRLGGRERQRIRLLAAEDIALKQVYLGRTTATWAVSVAAIGGLALLRSRRNRK